jgi:carboxypeptidase Taq
MKAYLLLEARHRRMSALAGAQSVLFWDRSTMMPTGGAGARAEQMAMLSVLLHELRTDAAMGDLLDEAESEHAILDAWQAANLREMRRIWRHACAVPADLVEKLSRAASAAEMCWRDAKEKSDFAALAPLLSELVGLVREQAGAKADAFGCSPYEALLDAYDPGRTTEEIDALFARLGRVLPPLLERVLERQARGPAPIAPLGPFADALQHALGQRLMQILRFDFAHGRLDVSHHPFTGGVPDDVRITTRYKPNDFTASVMAVIHETGHAQYERGLPREGRGQPVGRSLGMTVHESQSLLFEMQAGRSDAFLRFAAPLFAESLGGSGAAWQAENLIRLYRRVSRGVIRVDADEVTYPLHILLRYRLERALVAAELSVAELPAAWNEGMQHLVGVTPPDDASGVLQDIHWPSGALGYFPTYTLGALAAAQLFDAARRATPDLVPGLARGDFEPLLSWLREHVHGVGAQVTPAELIQRASLAPLGTRVFEAHLEARYLGENEA